MEGSKMADLTQARALEYYNYDASTGTFFFNERPRHEFSRQELYTRHLQRVGTKAGSSNSEGYLKLLIDGKYYSGHRIAWLIMTGEIVQYPEFEIDHINGNRGDNRFSNLRKVTKSENQRNGSKRVNNTSGVHGVNWKPKYNSTPGDGRWVARIWNGPRHVYLGGFKEKREAEIARKAAERVLGFTGTDREPYQKKDTANGK
jgi:HNH endonuclease